MPEPRDDEQQPDSNPFLDFDDLELLDDDIPEAEAVPNAELPPLSELADTHTIPPAEPVAADSNFDDDSSILFESPEILMEDSQSDPFGSLPAPTSGASLADWGERVQPGEAINASGEPLLFDSVSDNDLLRYAESEGEAIEPTPSLESTPPSAEAVDEDFLELENLSDPARDSSSAVPLGGEGPLGSLVELNIPDDDLIIDDDIPQATSIHNTDDLILIDDANNLGLSDEPTMRDEPADIYGIAEDTTEPSRGDPPSGGNSSILDLMLGNDGDTGVSPSNASDALNLSYRKPTPPEDDDAFLTGDDAIDMIEADGPTTSTSITDDEALSELSLDPFPSNMGELDPSRSGRVTDSHVSHTIDEEWQSHSNTSGEEVSGSMVPLGEMSGRRPRVDGSAIDLTYDPVPNLDLNAAEAASDNADSVAHSERDFDVEPQEEAEPVRPRARNTRTTTATKKEPIQTTTTTTPPRRRSGILGWLVGPLLGAGALVGAWYLDLLPLDTAKAPVAMVPPPSGVQPSGIAPVVDTATLMAQGKTDAVLAQIGTGELTAPSEQILRGKANLISYLGETLENRDPEKLNAAKADFEKAAASEDKAKAVHAILWLATIEEESGNLAGARQQLEAGLTKFTDQGSQRKLKAALTQIKLRETKDQKLGQALPQPLFDLGFVLLLQAPMVDEAEAEEPAEYFFEAIGAALDNNYADAIVAMQKAKALHLKLVADPVKQALNLNPESDRLNKKLFPAACDLIVEYWQLRQGLYAKPLLADAKSTQEMLATINRVIDDQKVADEKLTKLTADKKLVDTELTKTLAAKKTVDGMIESMTADMKTMELDKTALEKMLTKVKDAQKLADAKLSEVAKLLQDGDIDEADPAKGIMLLLQARKDLDASLVAVREPLVAGKFVAPKADAMSMAGAIEELITRAKTPGSAELLPPGFGLLAGAAPPTMQLLQVSARLTDARDQTAKLEAKLTRLMSDAAEEKATLLAKREADLKKVMAKSESDIEALMAKHAAELGQTRTPVKMLDVWLDLLRDAKRKAEAPSAAADAALVLKDGDAPAEAKAKALAVTGLAARNMSDYETARKSLDAALAHEGYQEDLAWAKEVRNARAALRTPPTNLTVLADVDEALKAFPATEFALEHGQLRAQRSAILFQADDLSKAKIDAEFAVKLGATASGSFMLGRIAERQGEFALAEKLYRDVLADKSAEAKLLQESEYRLSKVILEKLKPSRQFDPKETDARRLAVELAVSMILLQPASSDEVLERADKLIAMQDFRGHFLRAQYYLQKQNAPKALAEYVLAIKNGATPEADQRGLLEDIVRRLPKVAPTPGGTTRKVALDASKAKRHYALGSTNFYDGNYLEAEREFMLAVALDGNDARYHYYLGATRAMLGNPTLAETNYLAAAELERDARPNSREIGIAIERIQGDVRRELEKFRP